MRRTVIATLTLAFVASACSAPNAGLKVGTKEVPVDIVLGRQLDRPGVPPGLSPNPGFPGFLQPPIPRPQPGPPPDPGPPPRACPIPDPLDPVEVPALFPHAAHPPEPARYVYRNTGTLTVGSLTTTYPATMTRSVRDPKVLDGSGFEFSVESDLAGVTTTTRYRALNEGVTPDRGLYLIQVVTRRPEGTESFTPDQPILIMPFLNPEYGTNLEDELDAFRRDGYRSQGTDPLSQTTMILEARVDSKTRVNGCGKWIDAFHVEITSGKIVGPTKRFDFTGHYLVAPQYGGVIVEDNIKMSGTELLEAVSSDLVSTINSLPAKPVPASSA